jgi:hypothetical protein
MCFFLWVIFLGSAPPNWCVETVTGKIIYGRKEKNAMISNILFPIIFAVTVINLGKNKKYVLGKTKNPSFL